MNHTQQFEYGKPCPALFPLEIVYVMVLRLSMAHMHWAAFIDNPAFQICYKDIHCHYFYFIY